MLYDYVTNLIHIFHITKNNFTFFTIIFHNFDISLIMNGLQLRELRKKARLTQEELGNLAGITRRTIIAYEKSELIPPKTALQLRKLLGAEPEESENVNDESERSENAVPVTDPYEVYFTENKNGNSFMKLESGQYLMKMPLAEFNIQAGFLDHYQDIEYLDGLKQHSIIVDEPVKGRYVAFRVKGDSMDDGTSNSIVQGSIVSTRELQRHLWTGKIRFGDFKFWVIYTKNARLPLLKEIVSHDVERGIITCHSLNDSPEFADFDLPLDEVQALFYVINVSKEMSTRAYY